MPATIFRDVPCPFCSLLCDDLVINKNKSGTLTVRKNGCERAIRQFEGVSHNLVPQIKGREVSLDRAIEQVNKILLKSRQPLITGMGTDVAGVRSAIQLAEKTGAILDHMHSEGSIRNIKVLQDHGWMMTTLAEIKNRADLIILAGTDGHTNYPRFFERVIWNENALYNNKTSQREIIYIGEDLNTTPGISPDGRRPKTFQCKQEQISEIIATLHALIVGNKLQVKSVAGIKITELQNLAGRIKKSKYGILVWAPGELDFPHAELTIQAFSGLIKYLNRTTRFSGFTLGGNDGGATVSNVCTWLSGYPLRISYAKGFPEYAPYKYSTRILLTRKEVDALVWISSFGTDITPPKARIPTIIIGNSTESLNFKPDVLIPVGIPGVDHSGHLFRTDSVVALPLKKICNGKYQSVSEIIDRILDSMEGKRK